MVLDFYFLRGGVVQCFANVANPFGNGHAPACVVAAIAEFLGVGERISPLTPGV